jgi:hypothetical protein
LKSDERSMSISPVGGAADWGQLSAKTLDEFAFAIADLGSRSGPCRGLTERQATDQLNELMGQIRASSLPNDHKTALLNQATEAKMGLDPTLLRIYDDYLVQVGVTQFGHKPLEGLSQLKQSIANDHRLDPEQKQMFTALCDDAIYRVQHDSRR